MYIIQRGGELDEKMKEEAISLITKSFYHPFIITSRSINIGQPQNVVLDIMC